MLTPPVLFRTVEQVNLTDSIESVRPVAELGLSCSTSQA